MARKVLVFSELRDLMPDLMSFFAQEGAQVLPFANWPDLVRHIHDPETVAVLLAVSMNAMNGFECSRQIKEREVFHTIRVLIVSRGDVGTAHQEADRSRCDVLASGAEAEGIILRDLQETVFHSGKIVRREAARYELSGQLLYIVGEEARIGEILNASRSGVLFAAKEEIPLETELVLRFQSEEGSHFDVRSVAKRLIALSPLHDEFRYGIGVQLEDVGQENRQVLDWLLAYRQKRIPSWSYDAVTKILKANAYEVVEMLRSPTSRAFLDAFTGAVLPFEAEAVASTELKGSLVRELMAARVQCSAFTIFMPEVQRDQKALAPSFIPLLANLLDRIRRLEIAGEKSIQECRDRSEIAEQQNLIQSADRLHVEKLKLLFATEEHLTEDGLNDAAQVTLGAIQEMVSLVRLQQRKK